MRQLQCLLYHNLCYKKGETIKPTYIVVHSTGVANAYISRYVQPHAGQTTGMREYPGGKAYTAEQMLAILGKNRYANDWNREIVDGERLEVCVHAFIGKLTDGTIATVQTLPWGMRCWGVAYGWKGSFNNNAIQFEICEDNHSSAAYCKATYKEAVELCAKLCKTYSIPVDHIVSHAEANRMGMANDHNDPENWWPKHGLTMNGFRSAVAAELEKQAEAERLAAEEAARQAAEEAARQAAEEAARLAAEEAAKQKEMEVLSMEEFRRNMTTYLKELQDNDSSKWSEEARKWAVEQGIVNGVGDSTDGKPNYAWEAPITREQMVTMLYRFAKTIE